MTSSKELWTNLHKESRYRPKYPSETVVQYVFRNFERCGSEKVLDLGCGAGRHIFFMAAEGIIPYGLDYSSEGVTYTQNMLQEQGIGKYSSNIKEGSMTEIPFENEMFDGIICYGALYYLCYKDIERTICEMERVLKPGGKFMCVQQMIIAVKKKIVKKLKNLIHFILKWKTKVNAHIVKME